MSLPSRKVPVTWYVKDILAGFKCLIFQGQFSQQCVYATGRYPGLPWAQPLLMCLLSTGICLHASLMIDDGAGAFHSRVQSAKLPMKLFLHCNCFLFRVFGSLAGIKKTTKPYQQLVSDSCPGSVSVHFPDIVFSVIKSLSTAYI